MALGLPVRAFAVEADTLEGFIEWALERDDLTSAQLADLENAQSMLESYVDAGYIDLSDDDDAASLDNLAHSIDILQTIEGLRQSDEYYNQLYTMTTLYTNFTMMTGSAYTADVSIYQAAHVSSYSTFANNEGLAWGYTDPTVGWYTSEKALVDKAMDSLGYTTSSLTTALWSEVTSTASGYGTIGHYTGLFYGVSSGRDTLMGVGYTTEAYLYSKTSSYNATYPGRFSSYAVYTIDEFEELLEEYESHLISDDDITLSYTSCTYNGSARKPGVTVTVGGTKLTKGTDYTLSYSNNTDAGTATVTVTGCGDYTGTATASFTIKAKSVSSATVKLSYTSTTYSGKAKKPSVKSVKLTLNGSTVTLTEGTDYTVSYSSNTKVGTATVKVTGAGNYKGTVKKTFKIVPKTMSVKSAKSSAKKKATITWTKLSSANVTKYQIRYRVKGTSTWKKVTVASSKSSYTLTKLKSGKTYEVQVRSYKTVSGTKYAGSWSSTKTVKVK